MDTDLLVDEQIEDGERLIRQLIRDQFEVGVAFWIRRSEQGSWRFYIASSAMEGRNPNEAFRVVFAALDKIPNSTITPSEITLLANSDPIARDAMQLRDHNPDTKAKHYFGKRLGSLETEDVRIYPRRFPWEVRQLAEGIWQVRISKLDDVWLDCDSEEDARAIAAAPVLEEEALREEAAGPLFAGELIRTAQTMRKYRMGFGSRFLARRAQELR